jgi:hypothetical protein
MPESLAVMNSMSVVTVVLAWEFTPHDYFEQSFTVSRDDYTMAVDNGTVRATVDVAVFDATPNMKDTLCADLDARFVASQLFNHRPYELSRPTMARLRPDGSGDIFAEPKGEQARVSAGVVGVQKVDADGTFDSRAERREHERLLADRISAHSGDGLLGELKAFFQRAMQEPDNELWHLYDIRDALSKKFGGEKNTRAALGGSADEWSRLGLLPLM